MHETFTREYSHHNRFGYLHNYHLKNKTTMAHSIRRGGIIHDPRHILGGIKDIALEMPDNHWICNWFMNFASEYSSATASIYVHKKLCGSEMCTCSFDNGSARVAVNWSILFLEVNGIIPTTKKQIAKGIVKLLPEYEYTITNCLHIRRNDLDITMPELLEIKKLDDRLLDEMVNKLPGLKKELREYFSSGSKPW